MRILVAGASGVLGRQLVPMLVDRGHEVFGTTRSDKRAVIEAHGAQALYDASADVIERAGYPTRRTAGGEQLTHGFYFSLGHGVGLEVHEPPRLGIGGDDPMVVGDVIAMEPGIEGLEGIGGVRFEDLLLITDDGSETLTDYHYDL